MLSIVSKSVKNVCMPVIAKGLIYSCCHLFSCCHIFFTFQYLTSNLAKQLSANSISNVGTYANLTGVTYIIECTLHCIDYYCYYIFCNGWPAKMGLVPFRQPSTLFCCCHLVIHIFCCIVENKPSL